MNTVRRGFPPPQTPTKQPVLSLCLSNHCFEFTELCSLLPCQVFPDNAAGREIASLPARCLNQGCSWTGSIKEYEVRYKVQLVCWCANCFLSYNNPTQTNSVSIFWNFPKPSVPTQSITSHILHSQVMFSSPQAFSLHYCCTVCSYCTACSRVERTGSETYVAWKVPVLPAQIRTTSQWGKYQDI